MQSVRSLALLILLLCSAAVHAQVLPAAGAPAYSRRAQSHAWFGVPMTNPAILHLAPRAGAADGAKDAIKAAEAGSTRLATPLVQMPIALAAWEHEVFAMFPAQPPTHPGDARQAPTLALGAYPGPMGSVWAFDNTGGRLRVLPSLPFEGSLLSFVGTERGPAALLRHERRAEILLLETNPASDPQSQWRQVPLPEDLNPLDNALSLVSIPKGIAIVRLSSMEGPGNGIWTGTFSSDAPQAGSEVPSVSWTFRSLSLATGEPGRTAPLPEGPIIHITARGSAGVRGDGMLIYPVRVQDPTGGPQLQIWSPSLSGAALLSSVPDVSHRYGVAPLDDVGRIAILWLQDAPAAPAPSQGKNTPPPAPEIRLAEVSVTDGAIIYNGPAIGKGPVSSEELRLLAVAMVAIMALILVFVLRPEEGRAPLNLPRGVALAEPGRRVLSSLVDLVLASLVTSSLTGRSALDLILLTGVFTDAEGMLGLLFMLATGFVLSTLGEWLFARSIGKALSGCAVAVPRIVEMPDPENAATRERVPTLARPSLWRAAVRNLVKWFLPPVAMMGLSSPDHRHRGDISAGTVVVIPVDNQD